MCGTAVIVGERLCFCDGQSGAAGLVSPVGEGGEYQHNEIFEVVKGCSYIVSHVTVLHSSRSVYFCAVKLTEIHYKLQ